jgi:ADP-heptose:LPS heptosyltransferase
MTTRILVIQLRQLGDILLTTPVMTELRRLVPDAHITFFSHAMGHLVIDGSPDVDEFFTYGSDWSFAREFDLARTFRRRKFDVVFDFMNNPRSALYAFATAAPQRWAFRSARRWAYTNVAPRDGAPEYIVKEKFRLLEAAGLQPRAESASALVLPWFEKHTGPLMKMFSGHAAFQSGLRVVLSPTHRREERRWPLASWAAFADKLVAEQNSHVMWVWGPGEEPVIDEVMKLCKRPTQKCLPTSFREMAALVANCDLFVGNSNGPSHVAVAIGTPSIQLHGPTLAQSWCPLTPEHQAVCAQSHLVRGSMEDISVTKVWEKFLSMLPLLNQKAEAARAGGVRLTWQRY